jgi:hypothetical protein
MAVPDLAPQENPLSAGTCDRRASVRYTTDLPSLCQKSSAQTSDFWLLARIRDISMTGASLILNCSFKQGALVEIEPIRASSGLGSILRARVVHCKEEANGAWIIGCEFLNPLSAQELESLA